MYVKNQGFTLIEVMIAAAVGTILLLALASQMNNSNRQVHYLEAKMESLQLKQEIILLVTDATKCTSSLASVNNLNLTANSNTDVTGNISGSLQGLVHNYNNNSRYISVNSVQLFMPANKLDGSVNNSSPYEFQIKAIAQEKTSIGNGINMNIEGPTVSLNVSGNSVLSCVFSGSSSSALTPAQLAQVCSDISGGVYNPTSNTCSVGGAIKVPIYSCPNLSGPACGDCNGQLSANPTCIKGYMVSIPVCSGGAQHVCAPGTPTCRNTLPTACTRIN